MAEFSPELRARCLARTGIDPEISYLGLLLEIRMGSALVGDIAESIRSADLGGVPFLGQRSAREALALAARRRQRRHSMPARSERVQTALQSLIAQWAA